MSSAEPSTIVTILQCVSLSFGLLAAITGYRVYRYLATAVRCRGSVTKLVEEPHGVRPLFRPIFTFTDESGRQHSISSSVASRPAAFDVGDTIEIIYPPGQPSLAEYCGFFAQWALPTVFAVFATFTFLLAHVVSQDV